MLNQRLKDMRVRCRGFNLIELIITLLVIAILMSLAYPAYQDRIITSRRADGHALLYEAAQREQQFLTENGVFTATVGSGGLEMQTNSQKTYYQLSIVANNTSYTLTATRVAPQTADTECGDLTLTHLNVKDCSATDCDVNRCW